jgi:hypothetical protein
MKLFNKNVSMIDRTCAMLLQLGKMIPKDQLGKKFVTDMEKQFTKKIKQSPETTDDELLKELRESKRFNELLEYLDMSMTNMEVMVKECRKGVEN